MATIKSIWKNFNWLLWSLFKICCGPQPDIASHIMLVVIVINEVSNIASLSRLQPQCIFLTCQTCWLPMNYCLSFINNTWKLVGCRTPPLSGHFHFLLLSFFIHFILFLMVYYKSLTLSSPKWLSLFYIILLFDLNLTPFNP